MGSTNNSADELTKAALSARKKHAERQGLLSGLSNGNYKLDDGVGHGRANLGNDVFAVENLLSKTGISPRPANTGCAFLIWMSRLIINPFASCRFIIARGAVTSCLPRYAMNGKNA
jgi:hypothetical protein